MTEDNMCNWSRGNTDDVVKLLGGPHKTKAVVDGLLKVKIEFVSQAKELPIGVSCKSKRRFIKILLAEVAYGVVDSSSCVDIINDARKRHDKNSPLINQEISKEITKIMDIVKFHGYFDKDCIDAVYDLERDHNCSPYVR